jgi:Dna[CI] antecedent, DciA
MSADRPATSAGGTATSRKKKKRRNRRHGKSLEPISIAIEATEAVRHSPFRLAIPFGTWRVALGPNVSRKAVPLALKNGVLLVQVTTSAWAQELAMLEGEVRKRLASHGVEVEKLRFHVGSESPWTTGTDVRTAPSAPLPEPLLPQDEHLLAAVQDDELRALLGEGMQFANVRRDK